MAPDCGARYQPNGPGRICGKPAGLDLRGFAFIAFIDQHQGRRRQLVLACPCIDGLVFGSPVRCMDRPSMA